MERIFILTLLPLCTVYAQFNLPPETIVYSTDGRIRGFSNVGDSDVVLGAMMPVHDTVPGAGICSNNIYLESVDYVEAFLYSIDKINNDASLLPNIKLGYDIRDTCLTVDVAIEEAVDIALGVDPQECTDDGVSVNIMNIEDTIPVSAVIGAQVSFVSIPVASFLSLAQIPQISYLSTSVLLNDRTKYPYFYRTVPSDDLQAQVLIDIAVNFGWTFVSAVYSKDLYGEPGIQRFRELAVEHGICIGVDKSIGVYHDYQEIVDELLNSTANVIVLFASLQPSIELFDQMTKVEVERKFVWLTSDAVSLSQVVFPKYDNILAGTFGVSLFANDRSSFSEYFSSLSLSNNKRNPWFPQYYRLFYDCELHNCLEFNKSITASANYSLDQNTPFVVDAVYTFAHGLDAFLNDNCDHPIVWDTTTQTCEGQGAKLNGPTLQPYLANVSFVSPTGDHIKFQNTGSTVARYVVSNYQFNISSDQYSFVDVAMWNGKNNADEQAGLQLTQNVSFQFGVNGDRLVVTSVQSECQQCQVGSISVSNDHSCCGSCEPCLGQLYADSSDNVSPTECTTCPHDQWGNNPLNGSYSCTAVAKEYKSSRKPVGVFLIIVACVAFLVALFMSVVVIYMLIETKMKEMISLEVAGMILIGVFMCSLSAAFFVSEPSIGVCFFQRTISWMCFSWILSPLLFIQIRNTWNFAQIKGHVKMTFVDSVYVRLIVSFAPILIQLVLVIVSVIVVHPSIEKDTIEDEDNSNNPPILHLTCVPSHLATDIVQMLYLTALLILLGCLSLVGVKSSNKTNQVKYVAFTALVWSIFWIGFFISYFIISTEERVQPLSICTQISALITLTCFLIPLLFSELKRTAAVSKLKTQAKEAFEYSIRSITPSMGYSEKNTADNSTSVSSL